MANIFSPKSSTFFRIFIFLTFLLVAVVIVGGWVYFRTPYATGAQRMPAQPIPFSHEHHVGEIGIDCRYCHTSVEISDFAGLPSTDTCLGCHNKLFSEQPMLAPLRNSMATNTPIAWNRVNQLPDFVHFSHQIHVSKGVGCASCHGRIDKMPLTKQAHSLSMEWCLQCHRNPVDYIRPREFVFDMRPLHVIARSDEFAKALERTLPDLDAAQANLQHVRKRLADKYDVKSQTNCSRCHY